MDLAAQRAVAAPPVPRAVLPGTLVVGPRKTGTTWIYELLAARADVRLPRRTKETFFFDKFYREDLEPYARHFVGDATLPAVDIAPSYFASATVIDRVRALMPDLRIVVVLRDPVERLVSHYRHLRRYGQTDLMLADAVEAIPDLVEQSRYCRWIDAWAEAFPGRVHLLRYADLRDRPAEFAQAVLEVVGCPDGPLPAETMLAQRRNEGGMPRARWLAAFANGCSLAAKRHGLHGLVAIGKRIGLKRVAFGGGADLAASPADADLREVRRMFSAEYERYHVSF